MASERDTWQQRTGRKCPACNASLPPDGTCPACDPGTLPTAAASSSSASNAPASNPSGGSPASGGPASRSPASGSAASEPELEASSTRSGLPPMRLGRGTRVSVYRIESVLGEGGMGVVYRAWDEAVGRPVALKCLHTNLAGDPDIRRRFAREARVLRSYAHPNVIQVYDFVEFDYLLGIVMEVVDGPTLVQYLNKWRGRMPLGEVREIFSGVLQAIGEGHNQGIVHRDLKPDNILVGGEGDARHPKVVDFGIAKILEGTTYTMSGAFLGTCCYMSPEQVQHPAAADRRSDIYSLGVTLYQLCTGRVPFEGNHFSVMMAHVQQAPRPPRELRPDLPEELERLILDALAKDPTQRPATCEQFQERLEKALQAIPKGPSRAQAAALPPVVKGEAGVEMILVPGGSFQMGRERRSVYLDAFYMDATPVTNKDYITFVEITGYRPTDEGSGRFLSHMHARKIPKGKELHPVVFISYRDASAYAAWAGKRLPTEAEWEKAARGTDGRKYPWGRLEPSALTANYGKMHGDTIPVGSLPDGASPYGIQDLAGNVWEWCSDYDDPSFYSDGPPNNPRNTRGGPKSRLVMRGGSYMYGPGSLRTYSRTSFEAHYRFGDGGFRCVRSVE